MSDEKNEEAWREWHWAHYVWKAGQTGLPRVVRWSKYQNKLDEEGVWRQDSLQHSYSLTVLGTIFLARMRRHVALDGELLLTALLLHDHGEGELGKDTLYIDKNAKGDLAEYLAFRKRFEPLGPDVFHGLHRAFLLQFAQHPPEGFPDDAVEIMRGLARERGTECLAFEALERWDYVLYANDQFEVRANAKILVQTLRNQMPKLDRLAGILPGFREEVWTDEIASGFRTFVTKFDGEWIERKGET